MCCVLELTTNNVYHECIMRRRILWCQSDKINSSHYVKLWFYSSSLHRCTSTMMRTLFKFLRISAAWNGKLYSLKIAWHNEILWCRRYHVGGRVTLKLSSWMVSEAGVESANWDFTHFLSHYRVSPHWIHYSARLVKWNTFFVLDLVEPTER